MTGTHSPIQAAREAELSAGRDRYFERHGSGEASRKAAKDAEAERIEDEKRRDLLLAAESIFSKADRDRAGAEVADQAQTMLEGVKHLADREETILTRAQDQEVEALEGLADPKMAHEITMEMVIAQAINQPTPLANEMGIETEDRPLNNSGLEDRFLVTDIPVPEEKHVPKTRGRAKKIAEQKVPPAEKIVHEDNLDDAVEVVAKAPDVALS